MAGRGAMRMQREQFLDVESEPWWLLERELDPALEERRRSLGQCWGWTDLQWYGDARKLEELYLFLEQTGPVLLRDLDDAVDVDRRKRWLDELIEKKQPAGGDETQEAAAPETPAPAAAARVGAAGAAPTKRVSAFARAQPADQAEPEVGETGASPRVEELEEVEAELARLVDDIDESEAKELIESVDIDPVTLNEFVKDDAFLEGFDEEMARWDVDKLLEEVAAEGADAGSGVTGTAEEDEDNEQSEET